MKVFVEWVKGSNKWRGFENKMMKNKMKWERFNKWVGRYSKCLLNEFGQQEREREIVFNRKGVEFFSLSKEDFLEFKKLDEQQQLNFLDGAWNFFISMND